MLFKVREPFPQINCGPEQPTGSSMRCQESILVEKNENGKENRMNRSFDREVPGKAGKAARECE
jgi:hypothetical protein